MFSFAAILLFTGVVQSNIPCTETTILVCFSSNVKDVESSVQNALNRFLKHPECNFQTMGNSVPHIISSEEIQAYSLYFVKEMVERTKEKAPPEIDLAFYPNRTAYEMESARPFSGPVYSERRGDRFTIHICEEDLKDIPSLALQGWLEHEAMRCIQLLQPEYAQFNFKKNIFPLMPVTGLAENHILELIHSIESGLKKYLATKALTHMGGGVQQTHFYFFKISPVPEDHRVYETALPHSWTKALFLCRKFREVMPIFWLADGKIEFSKDLAAFWWKTHDYLIPQDKTFLQEFLGIPHRFAASPYPDIVVELFKKLKSQYLLSPKDNTSLIG